MPALQTASTLTFAFAYVAAVTARQPSRLRACVPIVRRTVGPIASRSLLAAALATLVLTQVAVPQSLTQEAHLAPVHSNWIGVALPALLPPTQVGQQASATLPIQILASFTLGEIRAVTTGAANSDFMLSATQPSSGACSVGVLYLQGTSCSVNIQFSPGAPGPRLGAILLLDNATPANLVATIYLNGMGIAPQVAFASALISTSVGNGTSGYSGDGGLAASAQLDSPYGMAVDAAGNLYIADVNNFAVRKVNAATGVITTVAGNGLFGSTGDGGPATSARLDIINSVAVDGAGNLYISQFNSVIREVNAVTGIIQTVAGNGVSGYSGDGGPATSAKLDTPDGIAVDAAGNLYITDVTHNVIRKVNAVTGIITTVAGNGTAGYSGDGGLATSAALDNPLAPVADANGDLYFCDDNNNVVRRIDAVTGVITTVVGTGVPGLSGDGGLAVEAQLWDPEGLALDAAGNLYVADASNNVVRKVSAATGVVTRIAGDGTTNIGYSGDGGSATTAIFNYPVTPVVDLHGNLFVVDVFNNAVRKVASVAPVAFGSVSVGSNSAAQSVVVTNDGSSALPLTSLAASTNFGLSGTSTTCSTAVPIAVGQSCALGIVFSPAVSGAITGSITVSTSVGAQSIPVSGTGSGSPPPTTTYTLSAPQTPYNTSAGGTVNVPIMLTPVGGAYNSAVAMSATGLPPGAILSWNPTPVTPGTNGSTTMMTIQLASGAGSSHPSNAPPTRPGPAGSLLALCAGFAAFALRRARLSRLAFAGAALAYVLIFLGGCNGYSEQPRATYNITVTGTSGSLHPATTVTVVVR
jgi:hypothetical protein